ELAWLCHSGCRFVPFGAGLSRLTARRAATVQRAAISLAGDSHSRQSTLAWLRHLRGVSICRPHAGHVLLVRDICLAVARSQRRLEFLVRQAMAHRPAVCVRCLSADADCLLSRLPGYGGRSKLGRLLEALDRIAVLARRPALVFVAIAGIQYF